MIPYPVDRKENVSFRAHILSGTLDDEKLKTNLYHACKDNILFWINTTCWIYDAKGDIHKKLGFESSHMPFITWPYQDEYILKLKYWIDNGLDGLTEKSRDMGATWMVLTVLQHYWQFGVSGNDFLLGSRSEQYVDRLDSMKPLFPKIRYQIKRQPDFLLPIGYNPRKHDTFMKLVNPESGNIIEGESNNANFGSGSRYKAVGMDEYAKWEHTDSSAWQSLSDVTNCRLPISSAKGTSNQFYRLKAGEIGEIDKIKLLWKKHPLKDAEWYEKEKKRRSPEDLAAEVDINYHASISNRAYESFNFNKHCAEPFPVHNPNLPINLCMDFNIAPMSWAIGHEIKGVDMFFDELSVNTTTTERVIIMFCKRYKDHKNKLVYIYGDASGKYGSTKSPHSDYAIVKKILDIQGWDVVMQVPAKNPSVRESLNIANKRFKDWEHDDMSWVEINSVKCPRMVNSFEQTARKDDGIDKKDNVEHMSDGPRYKWAWQYPVSKTQAYSEKL